MQRFSAQISKTTLFSPLHTIFCCSLGGGFVFGNVLQTIKLPKEFRIENSFIL